jgi:ferredoxin
LSFCFVYVREIDPAGAAAVSGEIKVGDQLCEMTPVSDKATPISLLGAPFDFVMNAFAEMDRSVTEIDLVFFRGTKEELTAVCTGSNGATAKETITVTVIENKKPAKGKDNVEAQAAGIRTLTAPAGANLRELLTDNGINVYQSFTRWTNCKGKQLCGTCIVDVTAGAPNTNRKSMDEASTLRENPDSYRLSCVTFAYGDCTVETFPPINPAQWTR